ncbi:glycosyltransferase [bacterium]|nr:glycosyltransferase [bacterium]
MLESKKISVIIAAGRAERQANVRLLIKILLSGSLIPDEFIIVEGVSPNSMARNVGVEHSNGDILVFIDDDAIISDSNVLENVIDTLLENETIGIVGTSQDIPLDVEFFQREYRREFARTHSPVVDKAVESDMATTLFCAVHRRDFDSIGGFDNTLVAGVDNLFRHRMRSIGKKVVVAPNTLVYHPLPKNWGEFYRREKWYGGARAILAKRQDIPFEGVRLLSKGKAVVYLILQWSLFPVRFFVGGPTGHRFGFWPLRAVGHFINATSYVFSVIRGGG